MVLGWVVVDDDVNTLDVQTTSGHVGRHKDVELAAGEVGQGALAVGLAQVAVDGGRLDPLLAEMLDEAVGARAWCARR